MKSRQLKHWFKILSLTLIIVSLTSNAVLYADVTAPLFQKGMSYVGWDRDCFASKYSDLSLKKLSEIGVEYVAICVTQYQEKHNSTKIKRTDQTPADFSIRHAIKTAHKLGMKVMLKPHIDLIDKHDGTYWRADIGFTNEEDWQKWAVEYCKFIRHYAKIAEKLDVELFCIGTELAFAAQKNGIWEDMIIPEVKKVYSGKLIYAANWDNYKNIKFWKDLDYVGIDAYFPLTYKSNPTVEDIKTGWEKWKYDLEAWQKQINKPIIFTEIGYASTSHAASNPWQGGTFGNADIETQAKCYKAFFESFEGSSWLAGVYWWRWNTNIYAGGKHNRQFTPQNKPAEKIIEARYKNMQDLNRSK